MKEKASKSDQAIAKDPTMTSTTTTSPTTTPLQTTSTMTVHIPSPATQSISQVSSATTLSTTGEPTATAASTTATEDPLPSLQLSVPSQPETSFEPSTLQLVLSAREAAEARARAEAEAAGDLGAKASPRKTTDAILRLPHLREPTKEPEPTDPDFTVRLGAFMERAGEDCLPRLLQK